jgi:hypothetical protein
MNRNEAAIIILLLIACVLSATVGYICGYKTAQWEALQALTSHLNLSSQEVKSNV